MVRRGLARDCPRFSGKRYAAAEREAADDGTTIGRTYLLPGYLPAALIRLAARRPPQLVNASRLYRHRR